MRLVKSNSNLLFVFSFVCRKCTKITVNEFHMFICDQKNIITQALLITSIALPLCSSNYRPGSWRSRHSPPSTAGWGGSMLLLQKEASRVLPIKASR